MSNFKKTQNISTHHQSNTSPSGFIFTCNHLTKPQCFQSLTFGLPFSKIESVMKINPGTYLFLFDCELKILHGVYSAISHGGVNIVPGAFGGKFPAQVRFKTDKDCPPLPESIFQHAIQENYFRSKFRPELEFQQVNRLLSLFQASIAPYQTVMPALPTNYEHHQSVSQPHQNAMPSFSTNSRHHQSVSQPPIMHNQPLPIMHNQPLPIMHNQYYAALPQSSHQYYAPSTLPPPPPLNNQSYAAHPYYLPQLPWTIPNCQQCVAHADYSIQPPPLSNLNGTAPAPAPNPCYPGYVVPA